MGMAVVVIANDFTAVNVALPTMEHDFHTDINTIQWVINAYALTFGVMIVTGGRLADMFGRRNAFFLGSAIFASMSALGGAAPSEAWLIGARVAMGIGGALMWPAILGMTYEILPEEKAGLAGGIIIVAAGLGNAIGPLLGGVLTDELSWRWIFFLNVPIALFAVGVTYALVHGRSRRAATAGSTTRASPRSRSAWSPSCSPSTKPPTGAGATRGCWGCWRWRRSASPPSSRSSAAPAPTR
jgi:MFS family permease